MGDRCTKLAWRRLEGLGVLTDGEVWLAPIVESFASELATSQGEILCECYVAPPMLRALASASGEDPETVFRDQILPTNPAIVSGDFGEMLFRRVVQAHGDRPQFPAERWRNRMTVNDTVRGTDLIGYVVTDTKASPSDLFVLAEVKTRAATTSPTVVREAYDGVQKDHVSRASVSLLFCRHALLRDGKPKEADTLARFANPHLFGSYKTRLIAGVVHDAGTWDDELLAVLPLNHGLNEDVQFQVLVVTVEAFRAWIGAVHAEAVKYARSLSVTPEAR